MVLRHSFAVQSLRDGMPIRDLQETLGHKRIYTTLDYERYLLPVTLRPNSPFGPDHPRPTPFTVPTYPSPQWTRGP